MARRVKIKAKKPKPEPGIAPFRVADFAHPTDLREKTTALIVGFGGPAGIIFLLGVLPHRDLMFPITAAWAALAFIVHAWFRPWHQLRSMARKPADSAEDAAFGNLLTMILGRIARLYPPAAAIKAVVVPVGVEPVALGKTILVPAGLRSKASEGEMFALLAHNVGHVAAGHTRWLSAARSVNLLPRVLYWASLPVLPLAVMVHRWAYYADSTADRFAALLAGEGKLVAQAILRIALNTEPADTQVSAEEVDAHLSRTEALQAEESEIVTHFRLGEYLKERPELYGRLRQVTSYSASDGFRTAVKKLRSAVGPQSASG